MGPNSRAESSRKLKSLQELGAILAKLKAKGRRIVHCHGVFDLLHPGHIRHLEAAKRRGDILAVTVTMDEYVNKGPGRPVFNQDLRSGSIAALGCVDFVAINDTANAVGAIRRLRPDLFVKGQDYRDARKDVTGGISLEEEAARAVGAKLIFTEEPMMSSTELLNTHFGVYPAEARAFFKKFAARYPLETVLARLEGLKRLKVLVVGEAIVDQYHYCQAMGKSPKETIVSTRFMEEESFAGGSLAVANHMAGFVSEIRLVTCLGSKNSQEKFIRSRLKSNVRAEFLRLESAGTIIKRRFVDPVFLTKMFEVSYLNDDPVPPSVEDKLLQFIRREAPKYDLVLVTDYGHGMIGPRTVDELCRTAKLLAVNTQSNSANHGYNVITKYPRADYVCIDEPELRLALRNRFGDLRTLVLEVVRKLKTRGLVVTRGHKGGLAYNRAKGFTQIPAFSQKVVDRTGAGDAYLALSSLCVAGGHPLDFSAFIGNAAGALKVATVCNRTPVEASALYKFVTAMLK